MNMDRMDEIENGIADYVVDSFHTAQDYARTLEVE